MADSNDSKIPKIDFDNLKKSINTPTYTFIDPAKEIIKSIEKINRDKVAKEIEKEIKVEKHYEETSQTNEIIKRLESQLNSIQRTLDLMYNSMGSGSQRSTREHIDLEKKIEEYKEIMLNHLIKNEEKDSLLKTFFNNIPLEFMYAFTTGQCIEWMKVAFGI